MLIIHQTSKYSIKLTIIILLFYFNYQINIVQSLPISGFLLQQSPLVKKDLSLFSYYANIVWLNYGPYTVAGFKASTSPKLKPLYSISQLQKYAISSYTVHYRINIINFTVDTITNQTQYSIQMLSEDNLTDIAVSIVFFKEELMNYFYSGWANINTIRIFNSTIPAAWDYQSASIDLRTLFQDTNFFFNRASPNIIAFTTGILFHNFQNCTDSGPIFYNSLSTNLYQIQFGSKYYKNSCAGDPILEYNSFSFILRSTPYMNANTQFYTWGQYGQFSLFTNSSTFIVSYFHANHSITLPLNKILYGLSSIFYNLNTITRTQFSMNSNAVYYNSSNTQIDINFINPTIHNLFISVSTIAFYKVECPVYYDFPTNDCTNSCSNGTIDNSTIKFGVPTCLLCHYTCQTCVSLSLGCTTCDSTVHHRVMNLITKLCDPLTGYFDDGLNNAITIACDSNCKSCVTSSTYCLSCYSNYQLVNNTCQIIGCLSSAYMNGIQICLACDIFKNFIFVSNSLCQCNIGFRQVYYAATTGISECVNNCGDGIYASAYETCDDGNLINGDGCNDQCSQERDFICSPNSPSQCILHANFQSITYDFAYKKENQNQCTLKYTLRPKHQGLIRMNFSSLIRLNISNSISAPVFQYDFDSGAILITFKYSRTLEDDYLKTEVFFQPALISSNRTSFILETKLNGINAPLIIHSDQDKKIHQISMYITYAIMIFALLQFYVGSYFHKMIGLETIHIFQMYFWAKMLVTEKTTSFLQALNSIKFSSNGYTNSGIIDFDTTLTSSYTHQKFNTVDKQFLKVDLEQYFLLNVNIFLVPVFIVYIVSAIYSCLKYHNKKKFFQTQDLLFKDQQTKISRTCDWIYNHFVFPYTMMFSMISFINTIIYLDSYSQNSQNSQNISNSQAPAFTQHQNDFISISFVLHLIFMFVTFFIFCHQIFLSYKSYSYSLLDSRAKQSYLSKSQKIQYDQNSPYKQNYHPLYVLVFMVSLFLFQLFIVFGVMIKQLDIGIQLVLGFSFVYFLLITIWKPYHNVVNSHNRFLTMNYIILLTFIAVCQLFDKLNQLSINVYISLISILLFCLLIVMLGGYIRIFIQRRFRKWLEQHSSGLRIQTDVVNNQLQQKQQKRLQNSYLFQNQLKKIKQKLAGPPYQEEEAQQRFIDKQYRQKLISSIKTQLQKGNMKQDFYFLNRQTLYRKKIQYKQLNQFPFIKMPNNSMSYFASSDEKTKKYTQQQQKQLQKIKKRIRNLKRYAEQQRQFI